MSGIEHRVAVVRDGVEAIDYLLGSGSGGEDRPTLVLLDVKLPKVGGLQVLRRIRTDPRTCLLPVVILSTSQDEQDIAGSYRNGANSYIHKPVDFVQFAEAVRNLGLYWLMLNESPPCEATRT
jgi:CheY-like chemotaxis protein